MAESHAVAVSDDGSGMFQPVMEKGDMCLFEVEGGYAFFKRGEGRINFLVKEEQYEMVALELYRRGWKDVDLGDTDEDSDT